MGIGYLAGAAELARIHRCKNELWTQAWQVQACCPQFFG
jgi:hypothetical protein